MQPRNEIWHFSRLRPKQGFDAIATGHYVQKVANPDGTYDILKGVDTNKDQSYFLALLSQSQIKNAEFPIGSLTKPKVRELAQKHKLPNAEKKDSQGICFLGDMNINRFLEYYIEDNPGPIINHNQEVVGQHKGLHRYTTGQRRGIGVPSNTDNEAYVVTHLDFKQNALHVAFDREDSPLLYASEAEIDSIQFINKPIEASCSIQAKPRYRDSSKSITYHPNLTQLHTSTFMNLNEHLLKDRFSPSIKIIDYSRRTLFKNNSSHSIQYP